SASTASTRRTPSVAAGARRGSATGSPPAGTRPPTPPKTSNAVGRGADVGDWIAAGGNRPRITSKTFNAMEDGADFGLARERVLRQVEGSLARLGVDRVDLYLTHEPDPDTPVGETFATFAALLERGLIGSWGVSNVSADGLREWLELGTPSLVQNSYSLLERGDEAEVLPLCEEHGIEYQA